MHKYTNITIKVIVPVTALFEMLWQCCNIRSYFSETLIYEKHLFENTWNSMGTCLKHFNIVLYLYCIFSSFS